MTLPEMFFQKAKSDQGLFLSLTVFPNMRKYISGAKVREQNNKPAMSTTTVDI